MLLFLNLPKMMAESRWVRLPLTTLRGFLSNVETAQNFLYATTTISFSCKNDTCVDFALNRPKLVFLLWKKFDKSHNGYPVPPCEGVERERMRDSKPQVTKTSSLLAWASSSSIATAKSRDCASTSHEKPTTKGSAALVAAFSLLSAFRMLYSREITNL